MAKTLNLGVEASTGKTFRIPSDAICQTFGILAVRGAGKTYTARVMAEELIGLGLPVVVIDPVGVCWGLRSSDRLEKHGHGMFAGPHEAFGVIWEEVKELADAMHANDTEKFFNELVDIGVAAMFAIASHHARKRPTDLPPIDPYCGNCDRVTDDDFIGKDGMVFCDQNCLDASYSDQGI